MRLHASYHTGTCKQQHACSLVRSSVHICHINMVGNTASSHLECLCLSSLLAKYLGPTQKHDALRLCMAQHHSSMF
jgi:hypothetical protein